MMKKLSEGEIVVLFIFTAAITTFTLAPTSLAQSSFYGYT